MLTSNIIMNSLLAFLTIVSISILGSIYVRKDDPEFMNIVLITQCVVFFNIFLRLKYVNIISHTVFIYSLLYSQLSCNIETIQLYGFILGVTMEVTRFIYSKCLFFNNISRNTDIDVFIMFLLSNYYFRYVSNVEKSYVLLFAAVTSFYPDTRENSLLHYILYKKKNEKSVDDVV